MKTSIALVLLLLSPSLLQAAQLYVTGTNTTSTTNGLTPETGWRWPQDVVWGGAGMLGGDTLNISGGVTEQVYNVGYIYNPTDLGSQITIRVTTNSGYNGHVILVGGFIWAPYGKVTIDGNINGENRLHFRDRTNLITDAAMILPGANNKVLSCSFSNVNNGVIMQASTNGQVSHCDFRGVRSNYGVSYSGMNVGGAAYNLAHVNNCSFDLNVISLSQGEGPDGIQGCPGLTVFSNTFRHSVGTVVYKQDTSYQHSDFTEVAASWSRIFDNDFIDPNDSCIDLGVGGMDHHQWFNNTFQFSAVSGSPSGIRIYNNDAPITSVNNILIANNTFIDWGLCVAGSASTLAFQNFGGSTSLSVSDVVIKNNIFYNCGKPGQSSCIYVAPHGGSTAFADWGIDFNLLNAGANGNASLDFPGGGTQVNGRTGVPSFVSYTAGSANNNLHLASGDTAATGNGTNLTALFTTDADGATRPAAGNWSIGAFENFSGSGGSAGTTNLVRTVRRRFAF